MLIKKNWKNKNKDVAGFELASESYTIPFRELRLQPARLYRYDTPILKLQMFQLLVAWLNFIVSYRLKSFSYCTFIHNILIEIKWCKKILIL